jgi:hypothetical protein
MGVGGMLMQQRKLWKTRGFASNSTTLESLFWREFR